MPSTIDDLTIFLRAVDKTKAPFGKVQKRIEKMHKITGVLAKGAAGAGAAFVAGFAAAANNGREITDELTRMAQVLGTTTVEADGLIQLIKGDTPSAEVRKIREAVLTLQEGFFDARQESGPLFDLIKDFGADIDLSLDDPQAQLRNFLEEVNKLGNESDRVGTIIANLGADDAKPFLEYARNAEAADNAIKALSGSLEDIPGAITQQDEKALNDYKKSSVELGNTWDQFSKQAFVTITPALEGMNSSLIKGLNVATKLLGKVREYFAKMRENRVSTEELIAQDAALSNTGTMRQIQALVNRDEKLRDEIKGLTDNPPEMVVHGMFTKRKATDEEGLEIYLKQQNKILALEKERAGVNKKISDLNSTDRESTKESQKEELVTQTTKHEFEENAAGEDKIARARAEQEAKLNAARKASLQADFDAARKTSHLQIQLIKDAHELDMKLAAEASARKAQIAQLRESTYIEQGSDSGGKALALLQQQNEAAGIERKAQAQREIARLENAHKLKVEQEGLAGAELKAAEAKMRLIKDAHALRTQLAEEEARLSEYAAIAKLKLEQRSIFNQSGGDKSNGALALIKLQKESAEKEREAQSQRELLQIENAHKLQVVQEGLTGIELRTAEVRMQSIKDAHILRMQLAEESSKREIEMAKANEDQRLQLVASRLYGEQGSRSPLEVNNAISVVNQEGNDELARLYEQQVSRSPQEIENAIGIVSADKMVQFAGQIDLVSNAYGNLSQAVGKLAGDNSKAFAAFKKTSAAFAQVAAITAAVGAARSASFSANPFAAIAAYLNVGGTLLSAVASIRSVSEGGGSASLPTGGSSQSQESSGPIGGTLQTPVAETNRRLDINISGIDRDSIYTGDVVERIVEEAVARGLVQSA